MEFDNYTIEKLRRILEELDLEATEDGTRRYTTYETAIEVEE